MYKYSLSSTIYSVLVLCLLCAAAVLAISPQQNSSDFKYASFLDFENVAFQHILNLPDEQWQDLPDNVYQPQMSAPDFWSLHHDPILWVKITVPSRIKQEQLLLELLPNTGVDGLLVQKTKQHWNWVPAEGRRSDDQFALPTNYLTFKLSPTAGEKTAYLKLNTSQIYNFSINTYDHASWAWESLYRNLLVAMVLGAMLLAFCYNLAIGLAVGERLYLIYSGYIASIFLYTVTYNGYLRTLFPEWGGQGIVARSTVYLVLYCGLVFAREFFNLNTNDGKLAKLSRLNLTLIVSALMASLFINDFYAFLLNEVISIISILLVFLIGIHGLKRGHPLAKLFVIAWGLFLIGGLTWVLMWVGVSKPSLTPSNLLLLGTASEICLLSLVLSYRYSLLKTTSEQLNKKFEKYEILGDTDELTGVANRRGFLKAAQLEFDKPTPELVWLALDIDHFKHFNDVHGQSVGDNLLAELGKLLKNRSQREEFTSKLVVERSGEFYRRSIVGRTGGEEFAILLINTSLSQARIYADRLMKEFSELEVSNERGENLRTTLSVGGVEVHSNDTVDAVWKSAYKKLNEAKNAGRNCAIITD